MNLNYFLISNFGLFNNPLEEELKKKELETRNNECMNNVKNYTTNKSDSYSNDREYNSYNKSNNSLNRELNDYSEDKSIKKRTRIKGNPSTNKKTNEWASSVLSRKESVNGE